jgi:hypothetical protein
MEARTKEFIFERLKHSIQLLASPPGIQLQLLPPYVCKADELALEFDHWREIALHNYGKEFGADQITAMTALDEKLEWLSVAVKDCWTDEAVSTSAEWQNVRHLAAAALRAFSWPLEIPPSYAHEYIPTKPIRNDQQN